MTSAPMRPIEVPPFQLQPLISDLPIPPKTHGHAPGLSGDFSFLRSTTEGALGNLAAAPLFSRVMGGAAPPVSNPAADNARAPGSREIRCAQAYNKDIFVGCSDGTLIRYSVRDDDSTSGDPYSIASQQSVPGNKAVDKIALVPLLSKALVLSGGIIHFYSLPAFDPLPQAVISPLRGVVTFAIDENAVQARAAPPPGQALSPVRLCVIRRRTVIVYALRERLTQIKDIPFAHGAIEAKLTGPHLCLADPKTYWIVNTDAAEALELMEWNQAQVADPHMIIRPLIVVSDASEFMLVIWTGNGALGLFMTGRGDPTRGTLEYPQYPFAICVDNPYVAALLPNNTIEIHSMVTLSIVAILPCPTTLQASFLSHSINGYLVPSIQRNNALKPVSVPLLSPLPPPPPSKSDSPPKPREDPASPASGPGPTPPSTPGPAPSLSRSMSARSNKSALSASLTRSGTLVSGPKGIHSLLPSTLVSQIDSLLESARIDDAIALVELTWGKVEKPGRVVDEGSIREIQLIHQRIAYRLMFATRFGDAGTHFLLGDTDPRLLVRLFPDLRGRMISQTDEIPVFSGVADQVQSFDSIDAIVMANLVRNYHPHIKPSVAEATPTAELRKVLNMTARDMLTAFLRKVRGKVPAAVESEAEGIRVKQIVDTTLLKLYVEEGQTSQMMNLIATSNDIIIPEVEPLLVQGRLFSAVCRIYEKRNDERKLLEIWTKMVDGDWKDASAPDPLPRIVDLLTECKDRVLVQRYGIWLIKHDPAASLKLFIAKDSKRGMKMDETLILRAIRAANANLGEQYLEHLVLTRRSSDSTLHTQLVMSYVDRLVSSLLDPITMQWWQATVNSYASRPPTSLDLTSSPTPFLVHLTTLPGSNHITTRVKLALFLQGSAAYDLASSLSYLEADGHIGMFPFETAIVHGKLSNHHAALSILVRSLRDATTAEAYCTLGGEVIPAKVALGVGNEMQVEPWGQLVATSSGAATGSGFGTAKTRTTNGLPIRNGSIKAPVTEEKKRELLGILMKVYMKGGHDTGQETAQLLNAQALNLDVVDILADVPPAWSVSVISSFLSRSLRRTLHEHQEGLLTKAIASGQNLHVSDIAHDAFRDEGAMIEEPLEGETDDTEDDVSNEKESLTSAEEDVFVSEKTPYSQDEDLLRATQPIIIPVNSMRGVPSSSVDSSRTRS